VSGALFCAAKTLLRFFRWFGKEWTKQLQFVCSDMWKPYLKVIAKKAGHAIHILDRFHIMANLRKAIDQVRAEETRQLKREGYGPVLTNSRWLLLTRPKNLTAKQEPKLAELLRYNLKSVRSYLLKEEFQLFWSYRSPCWAGQFLDRWCSRMMRSKIEPMKKMARQLRRHRPLLLNWFRAKGQFSSGIVEGFNNKTKLTTRKSYGFRTYHLRRQDFQEQKDVPAGTSRNQWGDEVHPGPEPVALRRADWSRPQAASYMLAMGWVRLGLWERPWARLNPGTKPSAASGLLLAPRLFGVTSLHVATSDL
jgi:hypothetical protein